jgi:hypothetical protein
MLSLAAHLVAFGGYEPGKAGFTPAAIHTTATITMEKPTRVSRSQNRIWT